MVLSSQAIKAHTGVCFSYLYAVCSYGCAVYFIPLCFLPLFLLEHKQHFPLVKGLFFIINVPACSNGEEVADWLAGTAASPLHKW